MDFEDDDDLEATRAMSLDDIPLGDDDEEEEEELDATRAMSLEDMPTGDDLDIAPPPPGRAATAPPATPASTLTDDEFQEYEDDEDDDDDATRMLDAMDLDLDVPPPPARPVQKTMELRIVSGPDRGKAHAIPDGDHLVGRGLDCDIVLADPSVSRRHFRLIRKEESLDALDMGGANGTNVNGERVSRQALEAGDQIEVGTTVMEIYIEGVEPRARAKEQRFDSEVAAARAAAPVENKKSSNLGLFLGIAAVGFLVLVGGGVAAWFVFSDGGSSAAAEATVEGEGGEDVSKFVKEANELIDDREWSAAVDKLKEARKVNKDNAEVKRLLRTANDEVDAAEAIQDGKDLVADGKFQEAFARFKEVSDSSEQHGEATDELASAEDRFFADRMKVAKAANDEGDQKAALAALDAILSVNPKFSEAKLMRVQIAGGGDDDSDPEPRAKAAPKQSAKSLFSAGLNAYHQRKWSAAKQAFGSIAKGGFGAADKTKASGYLAAVAEVSKAMADVQSAANNPLKASRAYERAYQADRRLDGHFGPTFAKQLTNALVVTGQTYFKKKRFAKAAQKARDAMNYDDVNKGAMDLEEKCITQAVKMLAVAKQHMEKKHYATARDLARQVSHILPAMDPQAAEAREIAKKASEASVAGDEDD